MGPTDRICPNCGQVRPQHKKQVKREPLTWRELLDKLGDVLADKNLLDEIVNPRDSAIHEIFALLRRVKGLDLRSFVGMYLIKSEEETE